MSHDGMVSLIQVVAAIALYFAVCAGIEVFRRWRDAEERREQMRRHVNREGC